MKRKSFVSIWCTTIMVMAISATNIQAESPYDGWWFMANEPGTGLSLEIRNTTMFAAIFTYDHGDPTWYSAAATYDQGQHAYSGTLKIWSNDKGQASDFLAPYPSDAGTFSLNFTSQDKALLTYSVTGSISPVTIEVTRFMPAVSPGVADTRVRGWWYDPQMNGIGIFIEAMGGTLFGAWYMYHSSEGGGLPLWFSFTGNFPAGSTSFTSPLTYWLGGSAMGVKPYMAPASSEASGQSIRLQFKTDGGMDVTWSVNGQETTFHMVRFTF